MAKKDDEPQEPESMNERILFLLEKVLTAQTAAPTTENAEILATLSQAMDRLADTQATNTQIAAAERRRAQRASNEVVHNRSVFNPRGETCPDGWTKPHLKCPMYIPWVIEDECITREEAELLNLLEQGTYIVTRTDDTKVPLDVRVETNLEGTQATRLLMTNDTAFNRDYFRLMPPLHTYLRQILAQHAPDIAREAAGVLTMDEELARIAAHQLSVSV